MYDLNAGFLYVNIGCGLEFSGKGAEQFDALQHKTFAPGCSSTHCYTGSYYRPVLGVQVTNRQSEHIYHGPIVYALKGTANHNTNNF